jgi:hypothetical protein
MSEVLQMILSRTRGGNVTNNSTWIRIGYWIYSFWRFTASTQVTVTMITSALVASQIPLTELHCTDSLTRTDSEDQLA